MVVLVGVAFATDEWVHRLQADVSLGVRIDDTSARPRVRVLILRPRARPVVVKVVVKVVVAIFKGLFCRALIKE